MNTPDNPHFLAMTATTIGEQLLAGLLQEIRLMPDCWQKLPEAKQADVLDRLQAQVSQAVIQAVHLIASADRKTAYGTLDSVSIKSGMRLVFKVNQNSPCRHELMDAVGQQCLIILGGAEEHLGNVEGAVTTDPDQNPLDLNGGDDLDLQDPDSWKHGSIIDGEIIPVLGVERFGGYTLGELAIAISTLKKKTFTTSWLTSRFALDGEVGQRALSALQEQGIIELVKYGETPDEDSYKMLKKSTEIDLD